MANQHKNDEQFDDAIAMLKADHQKVQDLFQQYLTATDTATKQEIATQVFIELETHSQLEEMVFYPAFEEETDDEGEELIEEARQDHEEVKQMIAELRGHDIDAEFEPKFRMLMESVQQHIQEEEGEMFPEAQDILAEQNDELVEEMQEIKKQLLAM